MVNNMMNKLILMALCILCACQHDLPKSKSIQYNQLTTRTLPTYGHDNLINEVIISHTAGLDGQLHIVNGCVGLDYDEKTGKFATIPILAGGSKLIENGTVLQVGQKVFRHGDWISLTGSGTVRDFYISLAPNTPYSPVPEHCHAQRYWFTGSVHHEKPSAK